jgi:hypothetical protein
MVLLGVSYPGLLRQFHTLTGLDLLDGVIGMVLGLYICAHPAANTIDLFFYERRGLHWASSLWSSLGWLALNVLALLVGWFAIFVGTTRLVW